jgi:hypothetical protein
MLGGTFQAILVADTSSTLAASSKTDLEKMQGAVRRICTMTNLELQEEVLSGSTLSYQAIHGLLSNKKNLAPDVLFFYYTGHGFHSPHITSPWPSILLSTSHEALNPEHICLKLLSNKARLTIILFDCCNSTVQQNFILKRFLLNDTLDKVDSTIKKMFLESAGTIIATASLPGYPAYAFEDGSLFTKAILSLLFQKVKISESPWDNFFLNVNERCSAYQQPYVAAELKVLKNLHSKNVKIKSFKKRYHPQKHEKKREK